ncbi:MAG: endonuclease NucS [Candidatus Nanoarchaeia archaeon]
MDIKKFQKEFQAALSANKTMCLFCRCIVSYSGRAEAELEDGDRLIIIKADNSLLVHQPEGNTPINYMKSGSSIELIDMDGAYLLKSENKKLKESLEIFISDVYEFSAYKIEDGKKLTLVGNERDMSDMIKNNPSIISKDFVPLSREEHTKFGFIDVFGHDGKGNLIIIECKRYTAGVSAVQQLRRYVEKIIELKGVRKETVRGILAAPDIAKNAENMLNKWGFTFVKAEPPKRHEKAKKNQKQLWDF